MDFYKNIFGNMLINLMKNLKLFQIRY